MGNRLQLQTLLESISGTENVYYQPPPSVKMAYPCIIYELADLDVKFADNKPYSRTRKYTVTLVDRNPDSTLIDALAELPKCKFDRRFVADNLHHSVFNLFF